MDLSLKHSDGAHHTSSDTTDDDSPLDGSRHGGRRRAAAADEERYDSYGAMDLSSSCSGSALEDNDAVTSVSKRRSSAAQKRKHPPDSDDDEDDEKEDNTNGRRQVYSKRRDTAPSGHHHANGFSSTTSSASNKGDKSRRTEDSDGGDVEMMNGRRSSGVGGRNNGEEQPPVVTRNGVELKARNTRKNIREVISVSQLNYHAKEAQLEERLRLNRLREVTSSSSTSVVSAGIKPAARNRVGADSDDSATVEDNDESEEDPNNSGMHVNDALNVPNADGSVHINIGRPDRDPDIFLAPQLAACVKPHQIGGLRFLYDNIIESISRYKESPGFGCILAHNMGLGKTLQIISFIDVFLENTATKKVLCIVPINTIQNWVAEFNYWLPAKGEYSGISEKCDTVKARNFDIFVLNDSLKNLAQRGAVINSWDRTGGVLLMGYELYRQLANRRHRRKRQKGAELVDQDEDDQSKHILEEVQLALVNPGPDLVICDEGHRIKNSHASISQALKQIKTKRRIVLTGYPLQNNLMEYWCMVDFVRPNYLGNKTEFTNMFERPIQNGQCIDSTPKDVRLMKHRAHVLHEQLKGFVQRRSHVVLKNSLPEKTEHVLFVRLTQIQRTLYKRFMEELISNRCVSNPLKAFAVCCKIWNHPDVLYNFLKKREEIDIDFDPEEFIDKRDGVSAAGSVAGGPTDFVNLLGTDGKKEEINYDWAQGMLDGYSPDLAENSNKLQIFLGILEECVRVGDRLLLFSQSLCTLNLIEQFLHKRNVPGQKSHWKNGVNYYRLDGSTSAQERERLINRYNADDGVILFLVSTRAGSLGVNLVGANRVVIFDASWNPCHDTQAVCRVYRYGQEKRTHIYRLVTDNSLEKKIYDRQINKQGMSDRIVDELNPDANLSSKEVHSLICDEQDDPEPVDVPANEVNRFGRTDPVMSKVLRQFGRLLTKAPVCHESQLVDRKDNRLSRAEKKLAERAYKLEKTSKITYSRPSYAAFYPKQGTFATNLHNPGSNGFTRNRYFENGKKLDNWLPAGYSTGVSSSPAGGGGSAAATSALVNPGLRASVEKSLSTSVLPNHPGNKLPLPSSSHSPPPPTSSIRGELPFPMPSFSNVLSAPPRGLDPSASKVGGSSAGDWSKQGPKSGGNSGDWTKQITGTPTSVSSSKTSRGADPLSSSSVISRPSVVQGSNNGVGGGSSRASSSLPASAGTSGTNSPSSKNGVGNGGASSMLENLSKQGIGIQEVKVPRELVIPTNPGEPPIRLEAGQNVLVICTPKGMYLRMEEKIIKIKPNSTMSGLFGGSAAGSGTAAGVGGPSPASRQPATTITIPGGSGNGSSSTGTGSGTESGSESSSTDNSTSLSTVSKKSAVKT